MEQGDFPICRVLFPEATSGVNYPLKHRNGDLPIKNGDLLLFNGTSKCVLMDYEWDIPSGYVKIAIEHGPFTVDLPIKDGDFS